MEDLSEKRCVPCQGGVTPLPLEKRRELIKKLSKGWDLTHYESRIFKRFEFLNFKDAMDLGVKIGELAEQEWHHPELIIGWGYLEVEIWTHKIDSLVESDFIFAAKIDKLFM